jgi:hypothetical protein
LLRYTAGQTTLGFRTLSSDVRLSIHCRDSAEADEITSLLGVRPSAVVDPHFRRIPGWEPMECKIWSFDSPIPTGGGDATTRLQALVESIRPFADKLASLDPKWKRYILVGYHAAPFTPNGFVGEFDSFNLPAAIARQLGEWKLDLAYEVIWHNHPDWRPPART